MWDFTSLLAFWYDQIQIHSDCASFNKQKCYWVLRNLLRLFKDELFCRGNLTLPGPLLMSLIIEDRDVTRLILCHLTKGEITRLLGTRFYVFEIGFCQIPLTKLRDIIAAGSLPRFLKTPIARRRLALLRAFRLETALKCSRLGGRFRLLHYKAASDPSPIFLLDSVSPDAVKNVKYFLFLAILRFKFQGEVMSHIFHSILNVVSRHVHL